VAFRWKQAPRPTFRSRCRVFETWYSGIWATFGPMEALNQCTQHLEELLFFRKKYFREAATVVGIEVAVHKHLYYRLKRATAKLGHLQPGQ